MERRRTFSGVSWEGKTGYCRAIRGRGRRGLSSLKLHTITIRDRVIVICQG
ncbi:hypothetical protein [Coleofasciculus chthonoplastes]|uniref:hypothetical protein n=1 Tax=Coleofasciculus chthonoplastes TaxID=64178 RepID=UPI0032F68C52